MVETLGIPTVLETEDPALDGHDVHKNSLILPPAEGALRVQGMLKFEDRVPSRPTPASPDCSRLLMTDPEFEFFGREGSFPRAADPQGVD